MSKELLFNCTKVVKVNVRAFAFIILTLLFSNTIFGQQGNLIPIKKTFDAYSRESLQEKIYLHTDKDTYISGEVIWFKIYNVHATFHSPLELSKVVYIEVLDQEQKSVIQTKVALDRGTGTGSVYLPLSSVTGRYSLRAYTSWMKNFSADYYFEKSVSIINTLKEFVASAPGAINYDVQFFPEGGNLVEGIQSRVAFRATDQNGKGINFTGALINQKNDTLIRFQPQRFGIGSFIFTPERGDSYRVSIRPPEGKVFDKDFLRISRSGYVMAVHNQDEKGVRVNIATNRDDDSLYLFIHTRHQVKVATAIPVRQGVASVSIDPSSFGDGISHFTIFNSARQPVCERLYFRRPEKHLLIEGKLNGNLYATRKKVDLSLLATNENGNGQAADMSISVFRADSLNEGDSNDIVSYLLLSSDLRGNIESPSYYFRNKGKTVDEELDNLMLTHGWRRFRWQDILNAKKPAFEHLPEFEGHTVKGKVTSVITGDPLKEVGTFLSIPGRRVQMYGAKSDDLGRIQFFTKDFYGSSEMIIQTDQRIDSTARIEMMSPFSENRSQKRFPELKLNPASSEFIKSQSIGMQVQNIYSSNKLRQEYLPLLDSSAFYGQPTRVYMLDDYTRFTTMEEVLREYVPEVDVSLRKKNLFLRSYNSPYRVYFDTEPLILLDGVPVFGSSKLLKHDPLQIQKLEVVPHRYYLGPFTFSGIASFSTYKGNLEGLELDPRSTVIDYDGLQLQREFYSPVYDSNSTVKRIPDFRNVLYWSGKLKSNKEGKEQVSFYTSDQTGTYTVLIQGITEDGRPGSTMLTFRVADPSLNASN